MLTISPFAEVISWMVEKTRSAWKYYRGDPATMAAGNEMSPYQQSSPAEGDSRIVDCPLGTQSLISQEVNPQFPLSTFSHRIACLSPLACEWTANRNRTACKVLTWNFGVKFSANVLLSSTYGYVEA